MQVGLGSDEEPGVLAVLERLGDGLEPDDVAIEVRARLELGDEEGEMVDASRGLGAGGGREA